MIYIMSQEEIGTVCSQCPINGKFNFRRDGLKQY